MSRPCTHDTNQRYLDYPWLVYLYRLYISQLVYSTSAVIHSVPLLRGYHNYLNRITIIRHAPVTVV